ncbi:DeoR family transcriptional regulator, partial [Kitasatospora sp. NPDC001574]
MTEPESPLLPTQRRENVLRELREHGTLRVADIARALGVSTVTIRRDVAQLADEGVIERVHGDGRGGGGEHGLPCSSGCRVPRSGCLA